MDIWGKNEIKLPIKCKYSGPFGDYTGYGEANRNAIKALVEAGVEVVTEKISYTSDQTKSGETYELAKELEGRALKYDIKILHIPSDGYLKYLEPTKYHIGHLFWETDSISRPWVWNCNLMDEIWTGGNIHKDHFLKAGVKVPIFVFPQAVETNVITQKPFSISGHKGFLFYSIFQWTERKNPKGLFNAYWKEFQGEENVSLLLKVYRFGFGGDQREQIRREIQQFKHELKLENYPRVFLCFEFLTTSDIMRIHDTGDCFVSAHRGEGWGIPQAEALTCGKPVISTNLGGIHEWLEDGKTALLTKWKPVPVFGMEFAPWYEGDQTWADVDEEDLRNKMRFVFGNLGEAKVIANRGRDMVRNRLSYIAVGQLMRNRLEDIQRLIK